MIKFVLVCVLFFAGCVSKSRPTVSKTTSYSFVQLEDSYTYIHIVENSTNAGIYILDAGIKSKIFVNQKIKYIEAPEYGIFVAIPEDLASSTNLWNNGKCVYSVTDSWLIDMKSQQNFTEITKSIIPPIVSYQSQCEDVINSYLVSNKGKLLAFRIVDTLGNGNDRKSVTYVSID